MEQDALMAITISDLEAMPEDDLRMQWAKTRDFLNAQDQPRRLWRKEDVRDGNYYHLRMMQAIALLILLGKWKWQTYSISDVGGPTLEYFERANLSPLNSDEPRQFLAYLLDFKRQHESLEYKIDNLLLKIVDTCPDLGSHNFKDDPDWFAYFRRFAKGLRHRSVLYAHGKPLDNYEVALQMKDLYYDELALLIHRLSRGIQEDARRDGERGRKKLFAALEEASAHLEKASEALGQAWSHCRPYIDMERKRGQLEHIFDPEVVKAARIGQFVRSYLLTLRMHGESDPDTHYLSLLEGFKYYDALAADPDFEAKIDALIEGLEWVCSKELATIEREVNVLIGRDVWTRQSFSNEGRQEKDDASTNH